MGYRPREVVVVRGYRRPPRAAVEAAVFTAGLLLLIGVLVQPGDVAVGAMLTAIAAIGYPFAAWRWRVYERAGTVREIEEDHALAESLWKTREEMRALDPALAARLDTLVPLVKPPSVQAAEQRAEADRLRAAAEEHYRRREEEARVAREARRMGPHVLRSREARSAPESPLLNPRSASSPREYVRRGKEAQKAREAAAEVDRLDREQRAKVAAWQRRHGLTPDGIIGPKTRLAMQAALEGAEAVVESVEGETVDDLLDDLGLASEEHEHTVERIMRYGSDVPVRVFCSTCGEDVHGQD